MKALVSSEVILESDRLQIFNPQKLSTSLSYDTALKALEAIEIGEVCGFAYLEVAFVDELGIVDVNKEYLGKDYVTDIITFRYDEDETRAEIEGTLFCCAPRISEQAEEYSETLEREFLRIFIHGLLHLAGYQDETENEKTIIRNLENTYLQQILGDHAT